MHKGEDGKFCLSYSCVPLKKMPFCKRIKLLRENGDCNKCCGDCPPNNCKCSSPRVCGGEKEGRGCGKTHEIHDCSVRKLNCASPLFLRLLSRQMLLLNCLEKMRRKLCSRLWRFLPWGLMEEILHLKSCCGIQVWLFIMSELEMQRKLDFQVGKKQWESAQ